MVEPEQSPGSPTAEDPYADAPRPVFQGDWNSATGKQKGDHSERVREWRRRQEAKGGGRMGAASGQPVSRTTSAPSPSGPADPTRTVLEGIRDDTKALASDRIRASQALIALDRGDAEAGVQDSDLVQLRLVLEQLTPEERLAWLQGERAEHAWVGGDAATR